MEYGVRIKRSPLALNLTEFSKSFNPTCPLQLVGCGRLATNRFNHGFSQPGSGSPDQLLQDLACVAGRFFLVLQINRHPVSQPLVSLASSNFIL